MTKKIVFTIKEHEKIRLDKVLKKHFPTYSRTYFQYLIANNYVTINGKTAKKRSIPYTGDTISIIFTPLPEITLQPEKIALDILFEDQDLLAINKPAGMVVHPSPGHPTGTFVHALLHHCSDLPITAGDPRPGIVHRLDKETSGVLLAAKTIPTHQKFVGLFSSRQIIKCYIAICLGTPKCEYIDTPIERDHKNRQRMTTSLTSGKEAFTKIKLLASNKTISLLLVQPVTGRTHQIRVHLQSIGHPILGDNTYGIPKLNQKFGAKRQFLHAYQLTFPYHCSKPLTLTATLPEDMKSFLSSIDFPSSLPDLLKEKMTTQDLCKTNS